MNVSLTPELENLVNEKVESGRYHSANEVIHQALRLLKDHELLREVRLEELGRDVRAGFDQIERGEFVSYPSGKALADSIKAEGRKQWAERNPDR